MVRSFSSFCGNGFSISLAPVAFPCSLYASEPIRRCIESLPPKDGHLSSSISLTSFFHLLLLVEGIVSPVVLGEKPEEKERLRKENQAQVDN